jgi:DNA-binding Lrp family transcriptional regulator
MSKFLAEVKGFTPLIDALVRKVGLVQAAVYGRIWRYCEMESGVCSASLETIAESLGISSRTVLRHVKELCEKGYLEDRTPDLRNRPHIYANTGRARITALVQARVGVTESHSGVTESHTQVGLKVTRRKKDSIEETPVHSSGEEPEGDEALEQFFDPRPERESPGATGNWADPACAGGSNPIAEALADKICRFNGLSGFEVLPEKKRNAWVRHLSEMIAQWGGATPDELRVAWSAWREDYGWHDKCNPFYPSFETEFGPLLVKAQEEGQRKGKPKIVSWRDDERWEDVRDGR